MHSLNGKFLNDRSGVAAIEFTLIVPVLILLLLGTVTLFNLYRGSLALERATSTVSDFMSRQTELNKDFLEKRIIDSLDHLVPHADGPVQIRVSNMIRTSSGYKTDWAYKSTPSSDFNDRPLPLDELPDISEDDSILVTETAVPQKALFGVVGIGLIHHRYVTAVRPRFTSRIKWTK